MRLILPIFLIGLNACAIWQLPPDISEAEKTRTYLNQNWSPVSPPKIEVWPESSQTNNGFPRRIILQLDPQNISKLGFNDQETFRLFFRDQLTKWLEKQQHPEALCTSVDLTAHKNVIELEIHIVCR